MTAALNEAGWIHQEVEDSEALERLDPPPKLMMLAEWRALGELASLVPALPLLMRAPKADGHPILVLPGFLAGDTSTAPLRFYLSRLGYDVYAWRLGRNLGRRPGVELAMLERLKSIHARTGKKVSLVGWSLGGTFARALALLHPEAVRNVVTLGSPFAKDLRANNTWQIYEFLSGEKLGGVGPGDLGRLGGDLPVPTTALYSKGDGIVNWQTCMVEPGPRAENVRVFSSHTGFGVNPAALWVVADRIAQTEDDWQPFNYGGPFSLAYRRSDA